MVRAQVGEFLVGKAVETGEQGTAGGHLFVRDGVRRRACLVSRKHSVYRAPHGGGFWTAGPPHSGGREDAEGTQAESSSPGKGGMDWGRRPAADPILAVQATLACLGSALSPEAVPRIVPDGTTSRPSLQRAYPFARASGGVDAEPIRTLSEQITILVCSLFHFSGEELGLLVVGNPAVAP